MKAPSNPGQWLAKSMRPLRISENMVYRDHEAKSNPAVWLSPPYRVEVDFRPNRARQRKLKPELVNLLHETFIDSPDYDAENLSEFLEADIYMRFFSEGTLAGIFTADLLYTDGNPVLHLTAGLVPKSSRSKGTLMPFSMGLTLDLASKAFNTDAFFVGMRTANPRVVAKLWQNRWIRFYPRRDWHNEDPRVKSLRPHFCNQAFGADRCDLRGIIFYDIYPVSPWGGKTPWHHDETVNDFCRRHLRPNGLDAFLFLGPTLPPFKDIPRSRIQWPFRF
ncbi:MAG: hypothetical protein K9N10_19035 [Deltaproteobacteria bacterium]|nr:hypothetical protein [Deltaproteobacteria bacterium]